MRKIILTRWNNGFGFVVAMWFLSRLVIVVAMELIAPLLHFSPAYVGPHALAYVPQMGWELFLHWDAAWYQKIATVGYEYANDGQSHSIAFFPLFPLVSRVVMTLGLPFEVAGTLVSNLALLGLLLLVYCWVEEHNGINPARWTIAVLSWCPLSLFGTVAYSEGLFLLLTTAALRSFDKRQHAWAALWGAMATATRVTGAALGPTFLLVAWRESRSAIAYAAGLATGTGLLLFSTYCGIRFGDPLAFVHAQRGWQHLQPDVLADILALNRESLKILVIFFCSSYLLWRFRHNLGSVAFTYGFCSLALLLVSGALLSINRFVYAIISLPIALGLLLALHPCWGYAIMIFFAIKLIQYGIDFAWYRFLA